MQSPLCKKAVVVTRRQVAGLADPKVQQVVMNMDTLEEEPAPHAKGIDIALAAYGVGKGSAKMAEEEVRKIEITCLWTTLSGFESLPPSQPSLTLCVSYG